jgi:hypothetical protein
MKKPLKISLYLVMIGSLLSGCIIWPGYWGDDGHHRHGGHDRYDDRSDGRHDDRGGGRR